MSDKIITSADEVVSNDIKLKEYITQAINEISDDYIINANKSQYIQKDQCMELIVKYRNILLSINAICKKRKKY